MYQKCVTVAKSSAQDLGLGSSMCRKRGQNRRSKPRRRNHCPARKRAGRRGSQVGPQIGTQIGSQIGSQIRSQIGTQPARPRRSPPVDSLNGLNSFLPVLEPSSEPLLGNNNPSNNTTQTTRTQHKTNNDTHNKHNKQHTHTTSTAKATHMYFHSGGKNVHASTTHTHHNIHYK